MKSRQQYIDEITGMLVKYAGINHPYVDSIVDDIWQYVDGESHVIWHFGYFAASKKQEFEALVVEYLTMYPVRPDGEGTGLDTSAYTLDGGIILL